MEFVVEENTKPKKENSLWVEKYRPSVLDGYIGNESIKESISQMIDKKDIPHLLLFGPAGTGKTTLAKMLVNNIPCDYLYINASAENGIENVREKLKYFSMGVGFKPLKVVILDEADYLTANAQAGLRNLMEAYSAHTRFIMTCNYSEKMLPAIVSRCQTFEIKPISKNEVGKKLVQILIAENVKFTKEDIMFCVSTYYPDIRRVINFAQQSNIDGSLKICKQNAIESDSLNKIVDVLKNPTNSPISDLNEIRSIIADIDPNTLETVYRFLLDKVDDYAKGKEAIVVVRLAEGLSQSQLVISKVRDIPFLACIFNIINDLK